MKSCFIDVHHHIIGENSPAAAMAPGWSMERDEESLDRLGITGALLSLPISLPASITRGFNESLARCAQHNPVKYGMLASLPSDSPDSALVEIDYALGSLQADGFCLPSNTRGTYIGDDRMDPVLEELNRRAAVVLLHPSRPPAFDDSLKVQDLSVYEFPFDTTRAMMDYIYRGKTVRFPHIRWIVSHAGGTIPFLAYRLSTVARENGAIDLSEEQVSVALRSLYYDLALSTDPAVFSLLKNIVGPEHILWGTDLPLRQEDGVRRSIEVLETASTFDEFERQKVKSGSVRELFPRFHL